MCSTIKIPYLLSKILSAINKIEQGLSLNLTYALWRFRYYIDRVPNIDIEF